MANEPANPYQHLADRLERVIGKPRDLPVEEVFDRAQTEEDKQLLREMHIEAAR